MTAKRTGEKAVFTTGEAAHLCYISQQSIIRAVDNGTLPGFRVPGSLFRRIPFTALYRFMLGNKIPLDRLQELAPRQCQKATQDPALPADTPSPEPEPEKPVRRRKPANNVDAVDGRQLPIAGPALAQLP